MSKPTSSLALVLALTFLSGCDEPTRTQVLVRIDADESIRFLGRTLHVDVYGGDGSGSLPTELRQSFDVTMDGRTASYPYAIALAPLDGHSTRSYRVVASAVTASQEVLATARLVSTYVRGKTLSTTLLLEDACRGVACGEDQTCRGGTCESALVDPASFQVVQAGTGGGTDGGTTDGGGTTQTGVCSFVRGGTPPTCSVGCASDLLRTSIGFVSSTRKGVWMCGDFATSESLSSTADAYRVTGFVPLGGTDGTTLVGTSQGGETYSVQAR